jgi:hypothetical protein
LVGAKPANFAFPRSADVFPVTMMAPSPASIIAGVSRRARWRSAIALTWKFRFSTSGSMSWNVPKAPAHGIVDQDLRRAKLRAHSLDRGIELRFVGHVAGIAA